jgi:PKD repeat protein
VTDKGGKEVYKPERPAEREEQLPLGGNRLPARAFVMLKPDQEPGTYTCKVTVTDRTNNATKTLEKQFDVVPKGFGIVFLYTSSDAEGNVPGPPIGVVGQNLFIQCALIGFGRGPDKKPNTVMELRVLDESGRPTLAKPIAAPVPADAPENEPVLFRFPIPFNREGSFKVELTAKDNVANKTATVTFPIKVSNR